MKLLTKCDTGSRNRSPESEEMLILENARFNRDGSGFVDEPVSKVWHPLKTLDANISFFTKL